MPKRIEGPGPNPGGKCWCGCSGDTPLARLTNRAKGHVRGKPVKYIQGHNNRKFTPGFVVDDFVRPRMETPCHRWTGRIDPDGYGRFGEATLAHVNEWVKANGPVPAGKILHHRCENPACVNPDHLDLETRASHRGRHGKITLALAKAVRAAEGTQRAIGERFGLSQGAVCQIKHGYDGPDQLLRE